MYNWQEADKRRLAYCKQASPEMTNREIARYYNFRLEFVNQELGEDGSAATTKNKRVDYVAVAHQFAVKNAGTEVRIGDVLAVLGCSAPTAYKIIDDSPRHFQKVLRGIWLLRNPQMDKANGL